MGQTTGQGNAAMKSLQVRKRLSSQLSESLHVGHCLLDFLVARKVKTKRDPSQIRVGWSPAAVGTFSRPQQVIGCACSYQDSISRCISLGIRHKNLFLPDMSRPSVREARHRKSGLNRVSRASSARKSCRCLRLASIVTPVTRHMSKVSEREALSSGPATHRSPRSYVQVVGLGFEDQLLLPCRLTDT